MMRIGEVCESSGVREKARRKNCEVVQLVKRIDPRR